MADKYSLFRLNDLPPRLLARFRSIVGNRVSGFQHRCIGYGARNYTKSGFCKAGCGIAAPAVNFCARIVGNRKRKSNL
jgi:hypothetical protein